jgi:hypothetical protein
MREITIFYRQKLPALQIRGYAGTVTNWPVGAAAIG